MELRAYRLRWLFFSIFMFALPHHSLASYNWQGPYLGAYLSEAYGHQHIKSNTGFVTNTSYFLIPANINSVNSAGSWTKNRNATLFGLIAGHDWFINPIIAGVIIDYGRFHFNTSKNLSQFYPNRINQYAINTSIHSDWLFTLRARLGYPTMLYYPTLLYVTGGMALAKVKVHQNFSDNTSLAGMGFNSLSKNQIGSAIGVGMELAPVKHFSFFFEYLYVNLPSVTTKTTISNTQGGFGIPVGSLTSPFSTTGKLSANIFKIGLNYRF